MVGSRQTWSFVPMVLLPTFRADAKPSTFWENGFDLSTAVSRRTDFNCLCLPYITVRLLWSDQSMCNFVENGSPNQVFGIEVNVRFRHFNHSSSMYAKANGLNSPIEVKSPSLVAQEMIPNQLVPESDCIVDVHVFP